MPDSLGGDIILVDASCDVCQKQINKTIESICSDWWKNVRYRRRLGTRRIKKRPKTLKLGVRVHPQWRPIIPVRNLHDPLGDWEIREVPYVQHPAPIRLQAFKAPGIMRGISPEASVKDYLAGWEWGHAETIIPNPYFASIRSPMPFDPIVFARLIAKIAHGIAVRKYGIEGFEPFLTDIIRGIDLSKIWYFVGGDDNRPEPIRTHLFTRVWTKEPKEEPDHILVEIRLFANLGAPIYLVIAGKNPKNGTELELYRGSSHKNI